MAATPMRRAASAYTAQRVRSGAIAPTTAKQERHILGGFCDAMGKRNPRQIGRGDVLRWMATMQHVAPGTRRGRFMVVRVFLDHLVREGQIPRNPARTIPTPKVPRSTHRALGGDDARALVAACPDARARVIVILGLQLGLRRSELAGLEVGDVDWSARSVRVTGKGGHQRVVPLTEEAASVIRSYLAEVGHRGGGPLLRSLRHPSQGIKPGTVEGVVRRALVDAGVKGRPYDGISTHALRHTAATDVHRATRDVLAVQAMLGHSSLAVTEVYVRGLGVEELREAMAGRRYAA